MLDLKPWRPRAVSAHISVNTADSEQMVSRDFTSQCC